jgi:RimJ/RimL family protein N-acetyltransferase
MLNFESMIFDLQPILENEWVELRPLKEEDLDSLYLVASDPLIWEQHPQKERWKRPVFEQFFREAMDSGGAFLIVDKNGGRTMGTTRFCVLKESIRAIEIGWTFLGRDYWGGFYNREVKKLMMDYAFQYVEHIIFFINQDNIRSQKAVEKMGGKRITGLEDQHWEPRTSATVIYGLSSKG